MWQSTLALFVVALTIIYKYLTWHHGVWKKLGLTGPKPSIFFGNFPSALTGKRHVIYDMDDVYKLYKGAKRAIGVFMTRRPGVLILDPKLAKEVMVTNFSKFHDNTASKWIMNKKADKFAARNPLFTTGDAWKMRRTDALAGFTAHRLSLAYPIWQANAQKLRQFLSTKTTAGSAILETKSLATRFSINVMADFLWGIDAGAFIETTKPNMLLQMTSKMLKQTFHAVGLYYQLLSAPLLKYLFDYRFYPKQTDEFFSKITRDAVEMRLADKNATERLDYLNYLLQLQKQKHINHDDIVGHILTGILNGHDVGSALSYQTLFYLAKYPETQERLRTEILNNLDADNTLSFEKLTTLPYLDQCVHETIRLITPIPLFARTCTAPVELAVDNDVRVPLKTGTVVTIPAYCYHHDSAYFPQPYEFHPERFDSTPHTELTKQGVFLPFGNGPRICLGQRLGLLEIKSFLAEVLINYRVKCCQKTLAEKKPDTKSFLLALQGDIWLEYEHL